MNQKKILIVVDMQNDFVTGALKNPAAEKIVSPIAKMILDYDGDVLATMDTHEENYLDTAEGKALPIPHCIRMTHGWRIVDEIESSLAFCGARILCKPTFGTTEGWRLDGYDLIEMVGTCTDICVISNALILKSLYPNATVRVHEKLCAGLTEQKHSCALEVMRSCQIEVV